MIYLLNINNKNNKNEIDVKLITFIGICHIIMFVSWYIYISNSSLILSLIDIGRAVSYGVFHELFNPEASRGVVTLTKVTTKLSIITKAMSIFLLLCTIIGFLKLTINRLTKKYKEISYYLYLLFSLYWISILGCTLLPFFAAMGIDRLYLLAYLLLIPYTIIGFEYVITMIYAILNKTALNFMLSCKSTIKYFSIFLSLYLLLKIGFIGELLKYDMYSISLSKDSITKCDNIQKIGRLYYFLQNSHDILMTKWISKNMDNKIKIWVNKMGLDAGGVFQEFGFIPCNKLYPLKQNTNISKIQNGYICLTKLNTKEKIGAEDNKYSSKLIWYNITNSTYYPQLKFCNKIYDNGGSQVLLP
jgi:hypothetical protein